jgi:hypothetical protein
LYPPLQLFNQAQANSEEDRFFRVQSGLKVEDNPTTDLAETLF